MTPVAWLVLTLVSLMFSALFSGTEIAYITSDRVRVELDVKKGGMLSRILGRFYADPDFFISTILVGNNIMLVIYGMGAAFFIEKCWLEHYHLNQAIVLILSTLISTGVILITGEFLSLLHIPEPTRPYQISDAVLCLKKKKHQSTILYATSPATNPVSCILSYVILDI